MDASPTEAAPGATEQDEGEAVADAGEEAGAEEAGPEAADAGRGRKREALEVQSRPAGHAAASVDLPVSDIKQAPLRAS